MPGEEGGGLKLALAQIDSKVGDLKGNAARIEAALEKARGADLAVFPEQSLSGYPALDLWEQPAFVEANLKALQALAKKVGDTAALVGFVDRAKGKGKPVHNAAALLHKGKIKAVRHKTLLPTYDVFDEARYFRAGVSNAPILFKGKKLGVTICEDAWAPAEGYAFDPVAAQAKAGADLLINLSASPFERGKIETRRVLLSGHAKRAKKPFFYCNLVGGTDELVFDGASMVLDKKGRLVGLGKLCAEDLLFFDTENLPGPVCPLPGPTETLAEALCLGIRDYVRKCGFTKVLLGLSGGIDSALVAALAVRALGPESVTGVSMPSMYSSKGSVDDAVALARNLGIRLLHIPITPVFDSLLAALADAFKAGPGDAGIAEQNLQSRIRGALLMALSNKEGSLLLSTGNKSELSVGYCTLYGDMNGGLSPLADLPKKAVYELARWINEEGEVIPRSSIDKAPSAELKPNQKDQDDLPPYDTVDQIVEDYIERRRDAAEIAKLRRLDPALVLDMLRRIDLAEYKRRQAPPSLKVSRKAFGVGRRMPIARGSYR